MIEHYDFGLVVVDGRRYTSDIIILPGRVKDRWWRREGHAVRLEDLGEVLEDPPQVLVMGTGYYGLVSVDDEVKRELASRGVEVLVQPTKEACQTFNELLKAGRKAAAALHLTC
ncbi:MAG: hypothetical protein DRJ69_07260 [Thermoprotei archaeon]|nr:MAG: hypothetical protein DRJ69_07260 [Thermoprotei archaeon]